MGRHTQREEEKGRRLIEGLLSVFRGLIAIDAEGYPDPGRQNATRMCYFRAQLANGNRLDSEILSESVSLPFHLLIRFMGNLGMSDFPIEFVAHGQSGQMRHIRKKAESEKGEADKLACGREKS